MYTHTTNYDMWYIYIYIYTPWSVKTRHQLQLRFSAWPLGACRKTPQAYLSFQASTESLGDLLGIFWRYHGIVVITHFLLDVTDTDIRTYYGYQDIVGYYELYIYIFPITDIIWHIIYIYTYIYM